jgi:hypothetical protein
VGIEPTTRDAQSQTRTTRPGEPFIVIGKYLTYLALSLLQRNKIFPKLM